MPLNLLKQIFARPYLAAFIVGSFIHVGKWLNYTVHNLSYFDTFSRLISNGIPFMLVDTVMPYLIPLTVITISRYLTNLKEIEFFNTFPELNPDIVIKCSHAGDALYLNSAAKKFLTQKNIPTDNISMIIPDNICSLNIAETSLPYRIEHQVSGETIEYLISRANNNDLFLSGRIKIRPKQHLG